MNLLIKLGFHIAIYCTIFSCTAQNFTFIKNGTDEEKLNGKVKSLSDKKYKVTVSSDIITKLYREDSSVYFIDKKGNTTERYYNYGEGNSKVIYLNKNDNKGNLIDVTEKHVTYNYYLKFSYKYDPNGEKIEGSRYDYDSLSLRENYYYKYDEKKNLIELSVILPNKSNDNSGPFLDEQDYKYIYKYDNKGNKIEETWCTNDNKHCSKTSFFTYDLFKNGNWTKKTEYIDGIAVFITEREIEYY